MNYICYCPPMRSYHDYLGVAILPRLSFCRASKVSACPCDPSVEGALPNGACPPSRCCPCLVATAPGSSATRSASLLLAPPTNICSPTATEACFSVFVLYRNHVPHRHLQRHPEEPQQCSGSGPVHQQSSVRHPASRLRDACVTKRCRHLYHECQPAEDVKEG